MEGIVKSLYVYPVKSLGGIYLESSEVTPQGLRWDRNWMLVTESGKFMTQRQYPQMAMFHVTIHKKELVIQHNGSEISVPFESDGREMPAKVWGEEIHGREVSADVSDWFSNKLGFSVYVLRHSSLRPVHNSSGHQIPFSDSAPFLLIGNSSLTDLNSKMNETLEIIRFRPNIVVTGFEPYAEDNWKEIQIGDCRFRIHKKCARCQLPNVNPATGKPDKNVLRFLTGYRKDENNNINFGVHLLLLDGRKIKVGDKVKVL